MAACNLPQQTLCVLFKPPSRWAWSASWGHTCFFWVRSYSPLQHAFAKQPSALFCGLCISLELKNCHSLWPQLPVFLPFLPLVLPTDLKDLNSYTPYSRPAPSLPLPPVGHSSDFPEWTRKIMAQDEQGFLGGRRIRVGKGFYMIRLEMVNQCG